MKNKEKRAREYNHDLRNALRGLWDFINPGQKIQARKDPALRAALERFGIGKENADEPEE